MVEKRPDGMGGVRKARVSERKPERGKAARRYQGRGDEECQLLKRKSSTCAAIMRVTEEIARRKGGRVEVETFGSPKTYETTEALLRSQSSRSSSGTAVTTMPPTGGVR